MGGLEQPVDLERPASRVEPLTASALLTLHALGWLVVGNLVGLLLAGLLLVPALGELLTPLSYGRWVPLHLNLLLYGWCALPLIGLLFELYRPTAGFDRPFRVAVRSWSASLAVGAVSWLAGVTSGKVFLDWSGGARLLFALNLGLLFVILLAAFLRQLRERSLRARAGDREPPWGVLGRGALLALLLPVPWVLFASASPALYPPINPKSGGPTGVSLLGSTLGIVFVFWAAPLLLRLVPRPSYRGTALTLILLALHLAAFALLDHGDRSHHEPVQLLALASVLPWWPLLSRHLRQFPWPSESRRWLAATAAWAAVLVVSGFVSFIPGVLEGWKFTNALVGHAHVAMAGLVTSFNALVLVVLGQRSGLGRALSSRAAFWAWHLGCSVLVAVLLLLGVLEAADAGVVIGFAPTTAAVYSIRWLAGFAMAAAAWQWSAGALRRAKTKPA